MTTLLSLNCARRQRTRRPKERPLTFPELFQLPVTVDMATAAKAFGFSLTTAYRLAKLERFPCTVLRPTRRYRIPTRPLLRALGIDETPVEFSDFATGVELDDVA